MRPGFQSAGQLPPLDAWPLWGAMGTGRLLTRPAAGPDTPAPAAAAAGDTVTVLHADDQLLPSAASPMLLPCCWWCGVWHAALAKASGRPGACCCGPAAVLLAALDHDSRRSSLLLQPLLLRSSVYFGCMSVLGCGALGDDVRCCCWCRDNVLGSRSYTCLQDMPAHAGAADAGVFMQVGFYQSNRFRHTTNVR